MTQRNLSPKRNALKVDCPLLADFDIRDRKAVRAAFSCSPALPMDQAWRDEPEKDFQPAEVRIGWRGDCFFVFAELTQNACFNRATEDNQPLYRFGDVFEMFVRDAEGESYVEFHLAPNGRRLQLLWSDATSLQQVENHERSFEDFMVDKPMFDFSQWIEDAKWCNCALIPSSALLPQKTTMEGRTWLASFSRYDYSSGSQKPVLSSTSPHVKLAFHRQQEWAELHFVHSNARAGQESHART